MCTQILLSCLLIIGAEHMELAWQGTRNVIEAVRKAGSVKKLVITSSVVCTHPSASRAQRS